MQGQQTQDAPQNDGLPDAVARLLADEPMASALAWQDLGPATPEATAPTPEAIAMRRLERVFHATMAPKQRPDKRERRLLRGMKGA